MRLEGFDNSSSDSEKVTKIRIMSAVMPVIKVKTDEYFLGRHLMNYRNLIGVYLCYY